MTTEVHDNTARHRYELTSDGEVAAFVAYQRSGDLLDLQHTVTDDRFEGQGLAGELVGEVLATARQEGWSVRPTCSYVRHYLGKHPDQLDLVTDDDRAAFELD